jgi:hypothetical protein
MYNYWVGRRLLFPGVRIAITGGISCAEGYGMEYKRSLYLSFDRSLSYRGLLGSVVPQGYSSAKLNNFCSVHYKCDRVSGFPPAQASVSPWWIHPVSPLFFQILATPSEEKLPVKVLRIAREAVEMTKTLRPSKISLIHTRQIARWGYAATTRSATAPLPS